MSFPEILVAIRDFRYHRDELRLLAFEPQSRRYIELETIHLLDSENATELEILQLVRMRKSVIVTTSCRSHAGGSGRYYLIQLDPTLAEIDRIEFSSITALATDGENIFISAEGDLIVLNSDLAIVGRVELTVMWGKKNAHDIFVYQKIAYVLDNVEMPVFIFKFDCSDFNNIRLLDKRELSTSGHLDTQWLDATTGRWYVLEYDGYRFTQGQRLYAIAPSGSLRNIPFQIVRENAVETCNYISHLAGNEILASTHLVPPWIAIKEGEADNRYLPAPEKLYLARVIAGRESVRIEPQLDLYPLIFEREAGENPFWHKDFSGVFIEENENHLFLMISRRNRLTVEEETATILPDFNEAIILIIDTRYRLKNLLNQHFDLDDRTIRSFALSGL